MFIRAVKVKPTSPLTFRKIPFSHKTIESYKFIPPTTLSGFLYRLKLLSEGNPLPSPAYFKKNNVNLVEYYCLETKENIVSLGAYACSKLQEPAKFSSVRMGYQVLKSGHSLGIDIKLYDPDYQQVLQLIHKKIDEGKLDKGDLEIFEEEAKKGDAAYLKGVYQKLLNDEKDIPKYSTFNKEERRAPLDWEYIIAENFIGLVVASEEEKLYWLEDIENYSFKLGKEGYAFIAEVYPIRELYFTEGEFESSTIIPLVAQYDFDDDKTELSEIKGPENLYYLQPETGIKKELFGEPGSKARGEYFSYSVKGDLTLNIPKTLIRRLSHGFIS